MNSFIGNTSAQNQPGQFINWESLALPVTPYGIGATQAQNLSGQMLLPTQNVALSPAGPVSNSFIDPNMLLTAGANISPKALSGFLGGGTKASTASKAPSMVSQLNKGASGFLGTGTSGSGTLGGLYGKASGSGLLGASGTTALGYAAGAGIGYGVGSINPWAKNKGNSQIGGTVGGLVGSFFGPVGTLAGSAAGSLIGGFLGPGPGNSWSTFAFKTGTDKIAENEKFFAKRMGGELGQQIYQDFGGYLETVKKKFGIDISGIDFHGGFNKKYGGGYFIKGSNDRNINFDPNDAKSVQNAYATALIEGLKRKGFNDDEVLNQIQQFDYKQYQQKVAQSIQAEKMAAQNRSAEGVPLVMGRNIAPAPQPRVATNVNNLTV